VYKNVAESVRHYNIWIPTTSPQVMPSQTPPATHA